jgi:phosphate-selective porin OprO/OprP
VKTLEQNQKADQAAIEARAKAMPKLSVGEEGFGMFSPRGDFALQFKGVLQVDSRTFGNDKGLVGIDSLLLRRVRPIFQGTVFRDFDFLFVPDFAPSTPQIFDAYINYRLLPELQLRGGKFKTPVGLEQLQADRDIIFNQYSRDDK